MGGKVGNFDPFDMSVSGGGGGASDLCYFYLSSVCKANAAL
jgi:hypothetical protein